MAGSAEIISFAEAAEVYACERLGLDDTTTVRFGMPWLGAAGIVSAGSLVTVGGRTGTGKSFFCAQLLAACDEPALFISLEDPIRELGRRVSALPPATQRRLFVASPWGGRLSAIARVVREAVAERGVRVVAIDYLQLVRYDGGVSTWSLADQIHNTLADLKALARELGFVLVVAAQVRRPPFGPGADDAPALSELKDSASIENSSELVVLLHENEHGQVVARVAKSKSSRGRGRQLYRRDEGTGWLVETDDEPLFDSEEQNV